MSLWQQMVSLFESAFRFPGLGWHLILLSIGLGLAFGAIWLAAYRPPLLSRPWLWAVGVVSAFLTWTGIAFVQVPLQTWWNELLLHFWPPLVINHWILLAAVPYILLSGIVQEAFKLVPVIFYRWRWPEGFSARTGLIAGAVAGAGFGIFEAVWVFNSTFAAGWNTDLIGSLGFPALYGFWERFFSIGFHIAASALAGYGLGRGWGWQFYLLAAFAHGILNYSVILLQRGILNSFGTEMYIAAVAVILTVIVLWLRCKKAAEADVMT